MTWVLKKDGLLLILDLTLPQSPHLRKIHLFYLTNILPKIGGLISGSKSSYEYLSASIMRFPRKDEVLEFLEAEGLKEVQHIALSGGIASIFKGVK